MNAHDKRLDSNDEIEIYNPEWVKDIQQQIQNIATHVTDREWAPVADFLSKQAL